MAARKGRPARIDTPFTDFERELREATALFQTAKLFSKRGRLAKKFSAVGLNSAKGRMIVGLAFMRVMGAWEQFLDEAFLRMMTGTATRSGATFAGTAPPHATLDLAFKAIKGVNADRKDEFLTWTDWPSIRKRANKYLAANSPFVIKLVAFSDEEMCVKYGTWIRNHVAHQSKSSVARFRSAVRGFLGGATFPHQSYTPCDLLVRAATSPFPQQLQGKEFFVAYVDLLRGIAQDIIA